MRGLLSLLNYALRCVSVMLLTLLAASCSTTKFVPEGRLLLDNVRIEVHDSTETFRSTDLMSYIRQRPNNRFLNLARMRLGVYNMSGRDSTRWYNKWMRRLGEPPVIYDSTAAATDARQLLRAVNNAGFLDAQVSTDSFPDHDKRRTRITYTVDVGQPHRIASIAYHIPDTAMRCIIMRDSLRFPVRVGDRLDRNVLEAQRNMVTRRLQNNGYWAFGKEFITFNADTAAGSLSVDLTMNVNPMRRRTNDSDSISEHARYIVRNVVCIPDYDPYVTHDPREYQAADTVDYNGMTILYSRKRYLRPSVLYDNCYFRPGGMYRIRDTENTYSALGRLTILKFINIRTYPVGVIGDTHFIDVYLLLTPDRSQSFEVEVEGTNSEGDFGVALGLSYTHRNAGKGSETFNIRFRGSYQAVNGNIEGFLHNRVMEYGIDASLQFPKFKIPFIGSEARRRFRASSELSMNIAYQERPEYTRIVSALGWNYKWQRRNNRYHYVLTPIDISYVYLPASTSSFIDQIAPDNPLLRYSYEDHFIMRGAFQFYHTTKRRNGTSYFHRLQKDIITLRANGEIAGNLLFLISNIVNPKRNFHDNPYKVFGIRYSQYFRLDGDFSYLHSFDRRNALACHVGLGVGVPYGNSSILPFEKRFYGGGANGVRGWFVRTLGPGRYPGNNSSSDFINQCGDIRINLSVEYRAKLFWVVEAGVFIDAGNVWTIRNYENQPYGLFRFREFYKELAAAYGVGIRLDFNYFLIRFDLGMKAHNPAINAEPWPLIHPDWKRDHAFHFSIGYPF